MKSPPSLPKLSPPTLRCNVSARWKYKEAIVHGNIEDCTWEYKLGIKFIRNEGEGTLSRCIIGQEIARGKAFFKSHTLPVFLAITWTLDNDLVEIILFCHRKQSRCTWKVKNFDNSKLSDLARKFRVNLDFFIQTFVSFHCYTRCSFVLCTDHY